MSSGAILDVFITERLGGSDTVGMEGAMATANGIPSGQIAWLLPDRLLFRIPSIWTFITATILKWFVAVVSSLDFMLCTCYDTPDAL